MDNDLSLTLPERATSPGGSSKLIAVLVLLLLVGAANLVVSVVSLIGPGQGGFEKLTAAKGLPPSARKDLALKLERQALNQHAAQAWKEYLAGADVGTEESAKVWYRLGKLYQEANAHEQALDAYYRSESFAKLPDLEPEINRRVQECLDAAGKFAALRYELADRVDIEQGEQAAGEEVLAEIGKHKITKAALDRRIEQQIEHQLESLAAFLPQEERQRQKEEMVKRFAPRPERLRLLNQLILEEILYRKAREDKLTEDPTVRALLRDAERGLLAQRAMDKELADQIKITAGDLRTYYQAHKESYTEPERAKISHILVKDEKAAKDLLGRLREGGNFQELAREHSVDEQTKAKGGEIEAWVRRGGYIPGIGRTDEATRGIFSTEAGKVVEEPIKSDRGFHLVQVREREPQRQKAFEEVRSEVYRALRAQKENEVREALLTRLKERYDVVIHSSRIQAEQTEGEENKKPNGENAK